MIKTIKNIKAIIIEQINRGYNLKNLIDYNLDSLLDNLIEKCNFLINDTIDYLNFLLNELENNQNVDLRNLFRDVRICIILLKEIEYFGISVLYHQTNDLRFINKLIHDIHQELSLPVDPPLAACISTKYYYYHPLTNVIFMPIGETKSLLHLPDIFHEIGHEILYYSENNSDLFEIHNCYLKAIDSINEHYNKLLAEKKRETGSKIIIELIETIHSYWKNNWINEFFCDLFACYSLGPAYVWAHLFLTLKSSDHIYKFLTQSHPSDDSRLLFLLYTLEGIGFDEEKKIILNNWNKMPLALDVKPENEYKYAYPKALMYKLAEIFLDGLEKSNFSKITKNKLDNMDEDKVMRILNDAWKLFLKDPELYGEWEEEIIKKLRSGI